MSKERMRYSFIRKKNHFEYCSTKISEWVSPSKSLWPCPGCISIFPLFLLLMKLYFNMTTIYVLFIHIYSFFFRIFYIRNHFFWLLYDFVGNQKSNQNWRVGSRNKHTKPLLSFLPLLLIFMDAIKAFTPHHIYIYIY